MTSEVQKRPHTDNPGGKGDSRPINFKWLLISSIVALLLCMILPLIFMLSMKLDFHAALITEPQEGVLAGARSEEHVKTDSTEYEATFVPSKLEEVGGTFQWVEILYGPLMLTGASLEFKLTPLDGNEALKGSARLKINSIFAVIVFFLVFIGFLFLLEKISRNPNAALWFVLILVLLWFLYGLLMWAIGGWVTGPVNDFLNQLLTEEQGSAEFSLGPANAFGAAIRIFLVGMAYWIIKHLVEQLKASPA